MNARFSKCVVSVLVIAALALPALAIAPLAGAQEGPQVTVNLTLYEGNPILTVGEEGAWDADGVEYPRVVYCDGMFHMLYLGRTGNWSAGVNAAVGYATSEDGLNWTKYEDNPVFVPDSSVAPYGLLNFTIMLDGVTWVMYFSQFSETRGQAPAVLRATAPSPTGPWTVEPEPVLESGTTPEWDWNPLAAESVLHPDEGYVLYFSPMTYMNSEGTSYVGGGIGRAISPDGVHWAKYDDPVTTKTMFAVSDPVLLAKAGAWDAGSIGTPVVRFDEHGWEMFYYGAVGWYQIGYATSEDGITWTRYGEEPILPGSGMAPHSVVVIDDTYYLYIVFVQPETYQYPKYTLEIGLATGTITRD